MFLSIYMSIPLHIFFPFLTDIFKRCFEHIVVNLSDILLQTISVSQISALHSIFQRVGAPRGKNGEPRTRAVHVQSIFMIRGWEAAAPQFCDLDQKAPPRNACVHSFRRDTTTSITVDGSSQIEFEIACVIGSCNWCVR